VASAVGRDLLELNSPPSTFRSGLPALRVTVSVWGGSPSAFIIALHLILDPHAFLLASPTPGHVERPTRSSF